MSNRSAKGSAWERQFCRDLSLWWTNGASDAEFWRTSGSGARATVRSKTGKRTTGHYGDVAATSVVGQPFIDLMTVELKRGYGRATIADILDKPTGAKVQIYESWFNKVAASAKAAGSVTWALIHKRDRRETMVWMPSPDWCILTVNGFMNVMIEVRQNHRVLLVGVPLKDFFEVLQPDLIKNYVQATAKAKLE